VADTEKVAGCPTVTVAFAGCTRMLGVAVTTVFFGSELQPPSIKKDKLNSIRTE